MVKECLTRIVFALFFVMVFTSLSIAKMGGPGLYSTDLIMAKDQVVGKVKVWNTGPPAGNNLVVQVQIAPEIEFKLKEIQLYAGYDFVPLTKDGNPIPGKFPYKAELEPRSDFHEFVLSLKDDLEFTWGSTSKYERSIPCVAVHADLVKKELVLNDDGSTSEIEIEEGAWAYDPENTYAGSEWGWWFSYEMAHPRTGHFIDCPVAGLHYKTPTHKGRTDDSGAFGYFPGEDVEIALGSVVLGTTFADHKISPLDFFPQTDTDDPRVINMARLLQSLDAEGDSKGAIMITDEVIGALEGAMSDLSLESIDFADSEEVEDIIQKTISRASSVGLTLVAVSAEDAKEHLDKNVSNTMFRKNISRTPDLASAKAKLNVMPVWFPAMKANGDPATYMDGETEVEGIPYYDEDGNFIRKATEAKPLVIVYTDEVEETLAADVFAAVSRDDGKTWKRKNISRMADRSSFTLENGEEYYGDCKKPVFQVKDNKILIAWTSKFARGGKPRYAIRTCPLDEYGVPEQCITCTGSGDNEKCELDYPYDDPYYVEDIWGVSGPQRSVDYTDQGYPEVGEVPYSAVWVARGIVATADDVAKGVGQVVGDIVWFKPERLTSARRDANQVFMGGADGAGFAITWQEDPEGLRPGEAKGPGPGWGGATTNHKTDIWYSYITWEDFAKVDGNFVSGGDPEHDAEDFLGRPKALVPMSLPVRISDNDAVNTDNMLIELDGNGLPVQNPDGSYNPILNPDATAEDADGSHRYGYLLEGLWNWDGSLCSEEDEVIDWQPGNGTLYEFVNQQDVRKCVLVTADGRALDGNTGAARPNLFLQTYTYIDENGEEAKSAWAIMAYEETKGVGLGPDDEVGTGEKPEDGSGYDPYVTFPDSGKNAIYHSFDFQNPDLVSAGTILNLPETDENGTALYVQEPYYLGSTLRDDGGYDPIINPAAGELITDFKKDPILAYENARRPRFILQSKKNAGESGTVLLVLYKEGEEGAGRPSDIMVRRCVVPKGDKGNPYRPDNFVDGVQNVSTVTPVETWINDDRDENAKGDGVKVCRWEQPEGNLELKSGENPYEDARAHRGAIRGDFVILGYSYTPNWAASRNAHDKYDFYIRRSFDGGETWTTDPNNDADVVHTDYFINPDGISGSELDEDGNDATNATKHYTVDTVYSGGGMYEPARNVSLLKNNKTSVIEPRIVAVPGTIKVDGVWTGIPEDKQDPKVFYIAYGTSTNLKDVEKAPEDLFLSFSMDQGTTFFEDTWVVNPESDGNHAGETVTGWTRLAKGDPEQGEVQIRMTPNGERFYGCWLEEGEEGSDIIFRRLMPSAFAANNTPENQADDDGDGFAEYQGDADDADSSVYPGAVVE